MDKLEILIQVYIFHLFCIILIKKVKNNNSSIFESIKKKHFNLWPQEDLRSIKYDINTAIKNTLDLGLRGSLLSDIYENWEYNERQCKFVVNGQRAYEFLNFDWFFLYGTQNL